MSRLKKNVLIPNGQTFLTPFSPSVDVIHKHFLDDYSKEKPLPLLITINVMMIGNS